MGGWCRPQTDGPGLRSAALILFANILLDAGQTDYVNNKLIPSIKFDLEWVHNNWQSDGCDLWEEVRSNDFFWNRNSFYYSLGIAEKLFNRVGDSSYASKCSSTASSIRSTLDSHWTGTFMKESDNRQKDSAVIHAFSSFGAYPITDDKVAKTISTYAMTFCIEYPINQEDNKKGIAGVLVGRYPGDSYAGGNPWQLLTAVLAKTFYQGATTLQENNGFEEEEDQEAWSQLLNIPKDSSTDDFVKASISAGDSVMNRLYEHVKNDGSHIAEQISKTGGNQVSAKDLTWSYANILSALQERKKATEMKKEVVE